VFVQVDPPDANVQVDGRAVSWNSPRPVEPGTHQLEIRSPGYHPYAQTLVLAEGERATVDVHLVRRGGGALTFALATLLLGMGAGGAAVAAHFAGDQVTSPSQHDAWRRSELGLEIAAGVLGGMAVIAGVAAAIEQARTGDPTPSAPPAHR
jgi:hypothetical protein